MFVTCTKEIYEKAVGERKIGREIAKADPHLFVVLLCIPQCTGLVLLRRLERKGSVQSQLKGGGCRINGKVFM